MPKIKKPSRSKLVKKLDTVFSQYIRLSNADSKGFCTCITCKKEFPWKEIQAGHFQSRKHYSIRWSVENVHPQCCGCNVFKYGEQYKYSLFLGKEVSEALYLKSKEIVKYTNGDIIDMTETYSKKLKSIQ